MNIQSSGQNVKKIERRLIEFALSFGFSCTQEKPKVPGFETQKFVFLQSENFVEISS